MKKAFSLLIALLCLSFSNPTFAVLGGGTGDPNDPLIIATADHMFGLSAFPECWDKHIKLTADIDLGGLTPLSITLTGQFDGDNHTITNMGNYSTHALFPTVTQTGVVKNLTLDNSYGPLVNTNDGLIINCSVTNGQHGRGIIADWNNGTITECFTTGNASIAGLVIDNYGLISHCYSEADVNCTQLGTSWGNIITNSPDPNFVPACYDSPSPPGTLNGQDAGGLVKLNRYTGIISKCYATGSVSATSIGGGLVAINEFNSLIEESFSTGNVRADRYAGGLVGKNVRQAIIRDCYTTSNLIYLSGWAQGGLVGINTDTHRFPVTEQDGGIIERCYANGNRDCQPANDCNALSERLQLQGLVGYGVPYTTTLSFWDAEKSGLINSKGGGLGVQSHHMLDPNTFMNWGCDPNTWTIDKGISPPKLAWQNQPGTPITTGPYANPCGTTGDPNNPYLIYTAVQLNSIGTNMNDWDKHFKLMNDIDFSELGGVSFNGMGFHTHDFYWENNNVPFTGEFDGNNFMVDQVTITPNIEALVSMYDNIIPAFGIFNYIDDGAVIKNLGISNLELNIINNEDIYVEGNIAGFVGVSGQYDSPPTVPPGTIDNCFVTGNLSSPFQEVYHSGFIGSNGLGGIIKNCYSNVNMTRGLAGFVGYNHGTISKCYSKGHLNGLGSEEGGSGFVGGNFEGTINQCFSDVDIINVSSPGGFASFGENGTYTNCFATGDIEGLDSASGFTGYPYNSEFVNCYYSGKITINEEYRSFNSISSFGFNDEYAENTFTNCFWNTSKIQPDPNTFINPDPIGVTGLPAEAMQLRQTFLDAGWDFINEPTNGTDDIWDICDQLSTPRFAFLPKIEGDINCSDNVDISDLSIILEVWLEATLVNDTAPLGGDGTINMADWSNFSQTQPKIQLPNFINEWLQSGTPLKDFAPNGGDGVFNLIDFSILTQNWMEAL